MYIQSCPYYLQKVNALDELESEILKLGGSACVLLNTRFLVEVKLLINDCPVECIPFDEEITLAALNTLASTVLENELEVIVGIGGGKVLDCAKALAERLKLPCIVAPSSPSMDGATSALSIIYSESGEVEKILHLSNHPRLCLVDETLLLNAPPKLFKAGVCDALSSYIEGRDAYSSISAQVIAKACFDTLINESEAAYHACLNQTPHESFSHCIEAILYMSCFAFENTHESLTHALAHSFTQIPALKSLMHGESVGLALLIHLNLINDSILNKQVNRIYKLLSIPKSFTEAGIDLDNEQMKQLTHLTINNELSANYKGELDASILYKSIQSLI